MKADPEDAPAEQELKPFLAHLEDLRLMLIRAAIAVAVGMAIAFPLTPTILAILEKPLATIVSKPDTFLRTLEVSGAFTVAMQIAMWTGLLISSPVLVIIFGSFIMPALTSSERKIVLGVGLFGVFLFAAGVVLGYYFTLPFALSAMFMMNDWLGIQAEWTVVSYVTFTTQLLLGFGLAFELPMVILILGKLGIVSSPWLRHYRRHAIVVTLVIAAALTPPDIFSQMIMAVPLILLYELCIWLIWMWEKQKRVQVTAAGETDS